MATDLDRECKQQSFMGVSFAVFMGTTATCWRSTSGVGHKDDNYRP